MLRGFLLLTLLLVGTVYPPVLMADLKCDVDLNFGMVVNKKHIRVIDESRTLYQINGTDQLIVRGNWLTLDEAQQADLKTLSEGIHYVVPKMIILASEGVELAVGTVEHVYVGLVGQDHKSYNRLQSSLKKVQKRIREKFIHANDNFYMGPGSLENVDDLVDRELEAELEQAINTSVGGVLSAIGGLTAGGDEDRERQIEDLSQRIETMEMAIERKVGDKADMLRHKARWFCNKMHHLDVIEERLRDTIPELAQYDVILTDKKARH